MYSSAGPNKVLRREAGRDLDTKHSNNFNIIRLLLATSVIISHSGEFIAGGGRHNDPLRFLGTGYTLGDLAVDGFYILSGFLIIKSWMSQPQTWAFLRKRILRIYPGFIVASLLSEFVFGPMGGNPNYWADFSPALVLRRIIFIGLPGEPNAFPDITAHTVNGSLWTIRYEFLCYLGVLVIGSLGLLRFRWSILVLWGLVTAYHAVQCMDATASCPGFTGKLSDLLGPCIRAFSMFLAGACYYLFADHVRYTRRGVFLAIGLLFPCMFQYATAQIAFPLAGGYLLLAAAFARSRVLSGFANGADLSYGVYLYGWPIQQLIVNQFRQIDSVSLMVASVAISYAAGWLSWHLVEYPFLRLKPNMTAGVVEEVRIFSKADVQKAEFA